MHALAQVAHLDVSTNLPPDTLRGRLNDELPADINILAAEVVPHRFHARHDAVARRYLYQIARRRTAFAKAYVWWVKEPIVVDRMREAARSFVGMKDFESFAAGARGPRDSPESKALGAGPRRREESGVERSTLVLVDRLDIAEEGDLVLVAIEGSHFLWKMVRRIVGVLVEIGRGGLEPASAATFIAESSVAPARLTAPASGLFLERVYYRQDARASSLRAATPIGPCATSQAG